MKELSQNISFITEVHFHNFYLNRIGIIIKKKEKSDSKENK